MIFSPRFHKLFSKTLAVFFLCGLAVGVFAQEAGAASEISAGDTAWILTSSALVLAMTAPGLVLFYGGMVRGKNVLGTMMHSFIIPVRG